MTSALLAEQAEAPSGPQRFTRRQVAADDPGRVGAFVFELDSLFDADRFESARARAEARALAHRRGLDPLWTEVFALEVARAEGSAAPDLLRRVAGVTGPAAEIPEAVLACLRPDPAVERLLAGLRRRFKLGVLSTRPAAESRRLLAALGLDSAFDAVVVGTRHPLPRMLDRIGERAEAAVLVARARGGALAAPLPPGLRAVALASPHRKPPPPGWAGLVIPDLALVEALAAGATSRYTSRADMQLH